MRRLMVIVMVVSALIEAFAIGAKERTWIIVAAIVIGIDMLFLLTKRRPGGQRKKKLGNLIWIVLSILGIILGVLALVAGGIAIFMLGKIGWIILGFGLLILVVGCWEIFSIKKQEEEEEELEEPEPKIVIRPAGAKHNRVPSKSCLTQAELKQICEEAGLFR